MDLWRRIAALRYQLLLAAVVTVVSATVFGEFGIRAFARRDLDGNLFFRGTQLLPYHLPLVGIETAVQKLQTSSNAMVIEDADLGWVSRPGGRNELFTFNDIGVRVVSPDRVYAVTPPPGTLRVQVFGDSFALGDEVSNEESWANQLEQRLNDASMPAEVMNYGVNGYGIDQAYLRWRKSGAGYAPGAVVFALQTENVRRTVNVIRPLYVPLIDLPYSKPRFVRREGRLILINSPALPAANLASLLRTFDESALRPYEAYYDASNFRQRVWQHSTLLAFAGTAVALRSKPENLEADEQFSLALEILMAFEGSVRATGARFLILLTPRLNDLRALSDQRSTADTRFVQLVKQRFDVIDPVDDLARFSTQAGMASLFRRGGHYSPDGNDILAAAVFRKLAGAATGRFNQPKPY